MISPLEKFKWTLNRSASSICFGNLWRVPKALWYGDEIPEERAYGAPHARRHTFAKFLTSGTMPPIQDGPKRMPHRKQLGNARLSHCTRSSSIAARRVSKIYSERIEMARLSQRHTRQWPFISRSHRSCESEKDLIRITDLLVVPSQL
jgi:hypothetical protein